MVITKRRALAIVSQCVRPQRQRDEAAVGPPAPHNPPHRTRRPRQAKHPRAAGVGVSGQPFLQQEHVLGGPHQCSPSVFATNPDIAPVGAETGHPVAALASAQTTAMHHRGRPSQRKWRA